MVNITRGQIENSVLSNKLTDFFEKENIFKYDIII